MSIKSSNEARSPEHSDGLESTWNQRILAGMRAAVIGVDLAGVIVHWNLFAQEIYGWPSEEVLGRKIMDITVSSENQESGAEAMAAVLEGGTWAGEFPVRHKNGSLVDAWVTLSALRDESGSLCGIVGLSQELNRLKEAEGALRQSEEQFRAFADSLPELCWMADGAGNIFWYNQRWYEYTGTNLESMKGWGWQKVHDPKLLPEVIERWKASIASESKFEMEFPLRGADGAYRWFLTRINPILDAQGKVARWYGTNTNIDEQRQLVEGLSEARDQLEKRVSERTAELHTATESLRKLSGRLLQMRDEEQRRLARELHDSVGQLLAAISMNLAVVNSEAGKLSPAVQKCLAENAALVDEVSREIRTISHLLHPPLLDEAGLASALRWYTEGFAQRSRVQVSLQIPADLERLKHDTEITLFRVVQECLTNIHRHSDSPTATIRLRRDNDNVVLEVQDCGKGIPAEKLSTVNRAGHIGVGFGGMRERVRQLDGTLDVKSDGSGTLVKVSLPGELS